MRAPNTVPCDRLALGSMRGNSRSTTTVRPWARRPHWRRTLRPRAPATRARAARVARLSRVSIPRGPPNSRGAWRSAPGRRSESAWRKRLCSTWTGAGGRLGRGIAGAGRRHGADGETEQDGRAGARGISAPFAAGLRIHALIGLLPFTFLVGRTASSIVCVASAHRSLRPVAPVLAGRRKLAPPVDWPSP